MDKKVIFIDLDGTLIDTESGEIFPKGIWDMKIQMDVWLALKKFVEENHTEFVCIVTNQGGIEAGYIDKHFWFHKLQYIQVALKQFLGIEIMSSYCSSNDKNDPARKPNTGMLKCLLETWDIDCDKSEMIMIGDASGKPNDFSDTDKKTAENFGIDYMDVIELILRYTVKI